MASLKAGVICRVPLDTLRRNQQGSMRTCNEQCILRGEQQHAELYQKAAPAAQSTHSVEGPNMTVHAGHAVPSQSHPLADPALLATALLELEWKLGNCKTSAAYSSAHAAQQRTCLEGRGAGGRAAVTSSPGQPATDRPDLQLSACTGHKQRHNSVVSVPAAAAPICPAAQPPAASLAPPAA